MSLCFLLAFFSFFISLFVSLFLWNGCLASRNWSSSLFGSFYLFWCFRLLWLWSFSLCFSWFFFLLFFNLLWLGLWSISLCIQNSMWFLLNSSPGLSNRTLWCGFLFFFQWNCLLLYLNFFFFLFRLRPSSWFFRSCWLFRFVFWLLSLSFSCLWFRNNFWLFRFSRFRSWLFLLFIFLWFWFFLSSSCLLDFWNLFRLFFGFWNNVGFLLSSRQCI